jgi:hypothetical protein
LFLGRGRGRGTGRGRGDRGSPPVLGLQYAHHTNNKPVVPGTNGRVKEWITCWNCGQPGHTVDYCPETSDSQQGITQLNDTEIVNSNNQEDNIQEELQQHIVAKVLSDDNDSNEDAVVVNYQYHINTEQNNSNKSVKLIRKRECNEDKDILLDTGSTCSVFQNKD